jgi:hypothetical protein
VIDWQSFAAGIIVGTGLAIFGEILLVLTMAIASRWIAKWDIEP